MRYLLTSFLILGKLSFCNAQSHYYAPPYLVSVGFVINYNYSTKETHFGFEGSYWYGPASVDFGVESANEGVIIYSELQGGVIFGASLGSYYQFKNQGENEFGFQNTLWACAVVGFDYRYRTNFKNIKHYQLGGLLKFPIASSPRSFG